MSEKSKTIYHFGVSGGKDSTALLLWACYESGIPLEQIRATFCYVGNESEKVVDYIRMLSDFIFPIETISAALGFYDNAVIHGMFPTPQIRWCTKDQKMKPTQNWLNSFPDDVEIVLYSGVRASESDARSKMKPEEFDGYFGRVVRRPLLNWTIDDVWAIHDRYSVPRNPLYDLGFDRVGCYPCFMWKKHEIRILSEIDPDRIEFLKEQEQRLGQSRDDGKVRPFFYTTRIPESQRSQKSVTKSGKSFSFGTIDDVVRWSQTTRGGKQYALGHIEEDAFERDDDKTISCPSAIGQCE